MRVKKTVIPQREIICYPITHVTKPIDLFGSYPKNIKTFVPISPPPPPCRKSSRVNSTLKLFRTISPGRHETCFSSENNYYEGGRSKSAGPLVTTTCRASALKDEKNLENTTRIARRQTLRVSSASPVGRISRHQVEARKGSPSPVAFGRGISKERTFAEEKKRLEMSQKDLTGSTRILRNPDLKSPDEVKKAMHSTFRMPSRERAACQRTARRLGGNTFKSSTSIYSSNKSIDKPERVLRSTVAISLRKEPKITRTSNPVSRSSKIDSKSKNISRTFMTASNVSLARTSSTFSIDSTNSKKKASVRSTREPVTLAGRRKKKTASKEKLDNKKKEDRKTKTVSVKKTEVINPNITEDMQSSYNEAIMQQNSNVRSDCFFQNLFLRDMPSPTPSTISNISRTTTVLEKAKMWNNVSYKSEPSLRQPNYYLSQKRPVTSSKFKSLEADRTRSLSPERVFRPRTIISDHISKFDSLYQLSDEEDEFGNISRSLTYSYQERSRSEPPSKTYLTEVRQPNEPTVIHGKNTLNYSYQSESPVRNVRSPSCRRIQSFRATQQNEINCKKVSRARSLGVTDRNGSQNNLSESYSCSLNTLNYEKHVPVCCHKRSDRFLELNNFYSNVERVGQLEKATSSSDLRPIRKCEEIIDFDLWKKVRAQERAEKELNYLVRKLKEEQKEKDLLFRPHDVENIRWIRERDNGLRTKEKSVEDLRDMFHKKSRETDIDEIRQQEQDALKDNYKPLWRGKSVVDLASNMVDKYNPPERSESLKLPKEFSEEKRFGLSNKLMSTLSKDQINKIKNQLSEIYNNNAEQKSKKYADSSEKYVMTVPSNFKEHKGLTVRSNSMISKEDLLLPVLQKHKTRLIEKAESIGALNKVQNFKTFKLSETEQLSEVDKKRLSQTLSRELKDKIAQRKDKAERPKETRGATAAEEAKQSLSPRSCYSLDSFPCSKQAKENLNNGMIAFIPPPPPLPERKFISEKKQTRPTSIAESICSETSNRTVVLNKQQSEDVKSKIKYFEERKEDEENVTTIYHAREDSSPDEEELMRYIEHKMKQKEVDSAQRSPGLSASHSVTDIKELFGEKQNLNNFTHYEIVDKKSKSVPPDYRSTEKNRTQPPQNMISAASSFESFNRSRSISPEAEKYSRSYLNIVKTGDVRKIKDKFESLDVCMANSWCEPKRFCSDPELDKSFLELRGTSPNKITVRDHEAGDVTRITHKFELRNSSSRGRSRTRRERVISPIQKISFKKEDRFMPHIDIISKTAALKQRMSKTSSSSSWPIAAVTGEVNKIKNKFESQENMSLLGQMYTSAPDFRELKDISSYLSGSWVAHQFPKPQDNARSLSSPDKSPENSIVKKKVVRPSSASPPRTKKLAVSILKPYYDIFADQKFDPSIHRPKSRYVPDRQQEAETLWKKLQNNLRKPTVKFEGF